MVNPVSIKSGVAHRTQPLGLVVRAIEGLRQTVFPMAIGLFTFRDSIAGFVGIAAIVLLVVLASFGFSYLSWRRRTFTIGEEDIRVDSGILSRAASSVPFERIQDVSLERAFLPRLFGLVEVKFETGAGGAEDLHLAYLRSDQGEALRELVRERREDEAAPDTVAGLAPSSDPLAEPQPEAPATRLFAMGPGRLFTFGLFEFSLAVFAILFGLSQQFEFLLPFDVWDFDLWGDQIAGQGAKYAELGLLPQIIGALLGLGSLIAIGFATGIIRVFLRDWDFVLEKTTRGFRRQRGLFTRTDVMMPVHRVQAVKVGTGLLRRLFGWHNLRFVSLAQDSGSANHMVAPFARMDEIAPIVEAAGFTLPTEHTDWHRAAKDARTASMLINALFFMIAAAIAGIATGIFAPDWLAVALAAVLIVAGLVTTAEYLAWKFRRHALDDDHIIGISGIFSPQSQIATRVKLHSVSISQGPIARWRGYATLNLGLAGGYFDIEEIPIERARQLRAQILDTISSTDFSRLNKA